MPLALHIHRLTEKIALNANGYLYNLSTFAYTSDPLVTYTFKPKPHLGERMEIRLPDALGQDLLDRFHNRDESVSADRFEEYFKGIALIPDAATTQALLSFQIADTLSSLILYYHIDHDRWGASIEAYPEKQVEIPSAAIDNRGLLFGGIGWYTRLEFPYLSNLMQQGQQIEFKAALLKIYPAPAPSTCINTTFSWFSTKTIIRIRSRTSPSATRTAVRRSRPHPA